MNWSLNTTNKVFSSRSSSLGEPLCPQGTSAAGYVRDRRSSWQLVCLVALDLEDVENIYLFGFMIVGFLCIGLGVALLYWKVCKPMASQMANMLSATEIKKCFSSLASDRGNDELLKGTLTLIGNMQNGYGSIKINCFQQKNEQK